MIVVKSIISWFFKFKMSLYNFPSIPPITICSDCKCCWLCLGCRSTLWYGSSKGPDPPAECPAHCPCALPEGVAVSQPGVTTTGPSDALMWGYPHVPVKAARRAVIGHLAQFHHFWKWHAAPSRACWNPQQRPSYMCNKPDPKCRWQQKAAGGLAGTWADKLARSWVLYLLHSSHRS